MRILTILGIGLCLSFGIISCGDPSQKAGEEAARQHESNNATGGLSEAGYTTTGESTMGGEPAIQEETTEQTTAEQDIEGDSESDASGSASASESDTTEISN